MIAELNAAGWIVSRATQLSTNRWEIRLTNAGLDWKLGTGPSFEAALADAARSEEFTNCPATPPSDGPRTPLLQLLGLAPKIVRRI